MSSNGKKGANAAAVAKKASKQGSLFSFFSKKEKPPKCTEPPIQPSLLSVPSSSNAPLSGTEPAKMPTSYSQNVPPRSAPPNSSSGKPLSNEVKIGDSIEVYWAEDDEWYQAKVTKQKQTTSTYFIQYIIDGQSEWIDLSTESFRLFAGNKGGSQKRRILTVDDDNDDCSDENEYVPSSSDDEAESAFNEDDQWMVTDDEDEVAPNNKKQKTNSKLAVRTTDSKVQRKQNKAEKKSSSAMPSLSQFVAPMTVTQHSYSGIGKTTPSTQPVTKTLTTPQHITPMTFASGELSAKSRTSFGSATPMENSCHKLITTPLATAKSMTQPAKRSETSPVPNFEVGALNPAGSHVHNHLPFLQHPHDSSGRSSEDPQHDARTLQVQERDWIRIVGKKMTDAVKQWWDLKAMYFDTVLLFKTGKFYEMFHMDADIGVQICGLSYMKGHVAHAGFPEISYGSMADKLVRAGYKVARVEQTETPEQLGIRKKACTRGTQAPKVVNREVCSILTMGTRTFCYLDDESSLLTDEAAVSSSVGPLLSIREVLLNDESSENHSSLNDAEDCESDTVKPVCEYGITLVDAIRGSITIGQFADDVLRSRLSTLLMCFSPSEILIEGGENGASATLRSLLRSFQTTSSTTGRFLVETIYQNEKFPQSTALDPNVRKQLGRADIVHPWDVSETLTELHRRQYFPRASKIHPRAGDPLSVQRWPKVLRAAVEGNADLALSSLGASLFYLQRNLIDTEIISMGNVLAYIPPNTSPTSESVTINNKGIELLSEEQNFQESGVASDGSDLAFSTQLHHVESSDDVSLENDVTFMALDGTTLHNLEILTNSVDQKVSGSLWSKINYTKTPHGSRLLRAWLLRPLFRKDHIERRQDAVEELVGGSAAMALQDARSVLSKCGDIERLLSRVHSMSGDIAASRDDSNSTDLIHPNGRAVLYETATYTKRKVGDFAKVLNGLKFASQIPELFNGIDVQSGLIKKIVRYTDQGGCFPRMGDDLDWFFQNFDLDLAAKGLFEPGKGIDEMYDAACDTIDRIIIDLKEYKDHMCSSVLTPRTLAKSEWKYINTKPDSKDKYFIELPSSVAVPSDFVLKGKRGSGPKQVNKYLSPVIEKLVAEMEVAYDVQKERKAKGMEVIFGKFDAHRSVWAAAAHSTALLDALGALAHTAGKAGFTRPVILECPASGTPRIKVLQGRHPCVEHTFNSSEFIPNDLFLGCSRSSDEAAARVLLLSGPNMGGKSTLLRQTCLIAILAQIGSFVPAEHCELTPVDRIYTRLGASDRILVNQSTFFVELAETAAALRGASRRSLVIMDELGRGTSTFDGTAIASAAVQHLIERNKCLTLFATHYHSLLEEWKENDNVTMGHMECLVENKSSDLETDDCKITFLYTLGSGACPKSFGINVARLAGLPDDVLVKAKRISAEFEDEMSFAERPHVNVRRKQRVVAAIDSGDWIGMVKLWESLNNSPGTVVKD